MSVRPLVVFGTRPEVIKLAPVIRECRSRQRSNPVVCFTGQHRELAEPLIDYFSLRVDVDLALMEPNQTLASLTSKCLSAMDRVIAEIGPDCVVAQGDTTTVLATSLAAFFRNVPFVHVEAGLRTGNLAAPWPEEMNRRVASVVTAVHCAPTQWAAENLIREGVPASSVHVTGNTVVDALLWTVRREREQGSRWREKYGFLNDDPLVLVTSHRRENFGGGLDRICGAVRLLADTLPNTNFIYPVHLNPNVAGPVGRALGGRKNVFLTLPASYPEFVWLMDRSSVIITDSGGVQEEAPSLGKPVLVLRDNTERPEGVNAGLVELVGTSADKIVSRVLDVLGRLDNGSIGERPNPYGDGCAAGRVADLIESLASRKLAS